MNDTFLEFMVKRKNTPLNILLKVLAFSAAAIIFIIAMMFITSQFIGPFCLLIGVGAIYGAWYLSTSMNVEFEYIYTNGEIDVDKISAKRKRKRLVTVKITSFNDFDKFSREKDLSRYQVKYQACSSLLDDDVYYATFSNKENQQCILLFNPSERLLEAINSVYRRRIHAQQSI